MSLSWREGRTDSGAASAQDPAARSNVLSDSTGGGLARHVQRHVARLVVGLGLRHRLMLLAERQARHRTIVAPDAIERWQLDAFNRIWAGATQRFRFYADWKRRHRLPDRIGAMADLTGFPVLRATDIEQNLEGIVEDAGSCRLIFTGGSSGSTRLFPRGNEDYALLYASMYLGRSWAGIKPGDDIVHIWGHEHLFGAGAWRHLRKIKRQAMDWLIGTRRLNAYRLDDESVASYFEAIRARPGAVVIGYVSALRKLLDYVERTGTDGRAARVRAMIFCGETVFPKDLDRVRRLLGTVPLVEYGMQETGVMAYSGPDGSDLTFFWDAFHCHAAADHELVVSTLQPVRFPLINYGTEDRIEPLEGMAALPFRCARVTGRTGDVLQLTLRGHRRVEFHSDLIFDLLDVLPQVRSYFIHQKGETIDIAVELSPGHDLAHARAAFLRELTREFSDLEASRITFSLLQEERQTIAGKRQYLLRE